MQHYPKLVELFPWDVSVGYLASKIEQAHRVAMYCGIVKLHRVRADVTWAAIECWHMTRADFKRMFEHVFEAPVPAELAKTLNEAEAIRDRTLHGLSVSDADHRRAAVRLIEYAEGFHNLVTQLSGFSPFGDLRGFKGAGQSLAGSTSRLVLMGLGFNM